MKDLLPDDGLQVDGSTIALLRCFGLVDKAPRTIPIATPAG